MKKVYLTMLNSCSDLGSMNLFRNEDNAKRFAAFQNSDDETRQHWKQYDPSEYNEDNDCFVWEMEFED